MSLIAFCSFEAVFFALVVAAVLADHKWHEKKESAPARPPPPTTTTAPPPPMQHGQHGRIAPGDMQPVGNLLTVIRYLEEIDPGGSTHHNLVSRSGDTRHNISLHHSYCCEAFKIFFENSSLFTVRSELSRKQPFLTFSTGFSYQTIHGFDAHRFISEHPVPECPWCSAPISFEVGARVFAKTRAVATTVVVVDWVDEDGNVIEKGVP